MVEWRDGSGVTDRQTDRQTDGGSEWRTVVRALQGSVDQSCRLSKSLTDDDRQRVCEDVVDGDGGVVPVTHVQQRRASSSSSSSHTERRLHLTLHTHYLINSNDT